MPRDFFSTNAARYDVSRPPFLPDAERDTLIAAAELPPRARILDIGAGTGRVAIPFARGGYRVVAVDQAAEMVQVLRSKASHANLGSVVATGASLPFAGAVFDAVVIARVLYLTPLWKELVSDAERVLVNHGALLHEWANGTLDEPAALIKAHLRALLESAGISAPFHPGARHESEIDEWLRQRAYRLIDEVKVPLDLDLSIAGFLEKIESGEFSYTWKAQAPIKDRCLADLRTWTAARFDLEARAFASETSWKVFRHE